MAQQTAVEFFWGKVAEVLPVYVTHEEFVKIVNAKDQAIQMEREQIEDAFGVGHNDGCAYMTDGKTEYTTPEQYYNETYGKEESK